MTLWTWERQWREDKETQGKAYYFLPLISVLHKYDALNLIGEVVLDIGCGITPISNELQLQKHRRVLIDKEEGVLTLGNLPDKPLSACIDLEAIACSACDNPIPNDHLAGYISLMSTLKSQGYTGFDAIIASAILPYINNYKGLFQRLDNDLNASGLVFIGYNAEHFISTKEILNPFIHLTAEIDLFFTSHGFKRVYFEDLDNDCTFIYQKMPLRILI